VHKFRSAATVPFHLIPHMDLFTLCQIKPKKFLRLEIFRYFILQDLLITSPNFSYSELRSYSKQVTRFSKLRHHVYHHNWCVGGFGRMLNFNKSWHLDILDEQTFSPLPITFQDFVPIAKGV
jgi:hypothetical protein